MGSEMCIRDRDELDLAGIFVGGEAMGEELLDWGRDTFGTTISEGYGQTEMNLMLLNSPDWFEVRPGSCGCRSSARSPFRDRSNSGIYS